MTPCTNCGKDLSKLKSIYALYGYLYCSRDCYHEDYMNQLGDLDDCAEEVSPEEIGLVVETENSSKEANA